MASSFLDVCRFNPTLGGTTDWTYSSAVTGYQSPTAAGAVNGAIYSYRAESANLAEWEVGFGAYNSGTGVFARTTVLFNSLGTTAKIAFSAAPQVAIVALAEDLLSVIRVQKFTASGTYTPSAGMLYCIIECVGGGGGGGGALGAAATSYSGGGGGGGGYARLYASAATIGASKAVTIGAAGTGGVSAASGGVGGATSVGTICIANGGSGGVYGNGAISPSAGAGGSGSTGDLLCVGGPGVAGTYSSTTAGFIAMGGSGGPSMFGGGAAAPGYSSGVAINGNTATGFGGGGSGAASNNNTTGVTGGAGCAGIVIITEFCTR